MARINYGHDGGSPLRWIVGIFLAAGIGVVMVAAGRLGAEEVCGGACSQLEPMAAFLKQPFILFSETLTWCLALAVITTFLLWIALGSRQNGFAFILILALGLLGAAAAGTDDKDEPAPVTEELEEEEAPEETAYDSEAIVIGSSEVDTEPLEELLAEPEPEAENVCPAGNFWNGEGCLTCEVATTTQVSAMLSFVPASLKASWDYADARHVHLGESSTEMLPINDVSVNGTAPCSRDAILVIGSASSDGPLDRNLNRARSRARQLADHMKSSCGSAPVIFALSIGQSTAERDNFKDRALTVIGLDVTDGQQVTQELVEQEFGYLLDSGTAPTSLLSRIDYFPQDNWSWVEGGEGVVNVTPGTRPSETVMGLREGAPASCLQPS